MKKRYFLLSCIILLVFAFFGCGTPKKTETNQDHEHEYTHVLAVDPTCTQPGNVEFYACSCGEMLDATQTNKLQLADTILPALGHQLEHVEKVEPTEDTVGVLEHYHCSVCGKDFEDEAGTKELTTLEVAALGHNFGNPVIENQVASTCTTAGSYDEVVYCERCQLESSRETKYIDATGHVWDEGVVTSIASCTASGVKTFTCTKCQETREETIAPTGHKYVDEVVSPTCTEDGYTIHTCEYCEDSYKDSPTDKLGHDWVGELSCTTGRKCSRCGEEEEALGHNYVLSNTVSATCTTDGYEEHKCTRCDDVIKNKTDDATGHDISSSERVERLLADTTCTYEIVYKCANCDEYISSGTVYHHTYNASVETEATCKEPGVKLYKCSLCGDQYTEEIPINELGHNWVLGEVVNGTRTDTCSICQETREVTVYNGESKDANEFKDKEIEMENATLKMDDGVIDEIGDKEITLNVDKYDDDSKKEELGLTSEQLAQVGDNPIYDFKMKSGDEVISQFGENNYIVITLPYTLEEGEDVDSIAIWFINDNGELESFKATYSNGFVSFQTNHFSYYTVTKLTPAERCALYGHNYSTKEVTGNCLNDSYIIYVCQRCHDTYKEVTEVATGHDYVLGEAASLKATCITNGREVYVCSKCGSKYTNTIKATGHNYELTETVDPTCEEKGYSEYTCANCGKTSRDYVDALGHDYIIERVQPTCDEMGYTLHTCSRCDHQYSTDEVNPLGHSWECEFTFSDDHLSATATLTCKNDSLHANTLDAIVSVKVFNATCSKAGNVTYLATVTFDGQEFSDSFVETGILLDHTPGELAIENNVEPTCTKEGSYDEVIRCSVCGEVLESEHFVIEALGHELGELEYDSRGHFYKCLVCGEAVDFEPHTLKEDITLEPTCGEAGKMHCSCSCGYEFDKAIPATNEHEYEDGVCVVCGQKYSDCDHVVLHDVVVDLSEYGACGGVIIYSTCTCGERVVFDENGYILCDSSKAETTYGYTEDGNEWQKMLCVDCGLEEYVELLEEFDEECDFGFKYKIILSVKGTVIVDTISEYHYESHTTYGDQTLKIGNCGTVIRYYTCANCGKNVYFDLDDVDLLCPVVIEEEEIQIDNYTVKTITTATCPDCGAVYIAEEVTRTVGCEIETQLHFMAYENNELVFEATSKDTDNIHDYEISYKLLGDSCNDGIETTYTCLNCGKKEIYLNRSHLYETKVLDLSDYDICENKISYDECQVCGELSIVDLQEFYKCCTFDYSSITQEETIDENGNKIITATLTCSVCGAVYTMYQIEVVDDCDCYIYGRLVIEKGVFKFDSGNIVISHTSSHEWERTIVFNDPDKGCDGGYRVTLTCSKCGKVTTYATSGHEEVYHFDTLYDADGNQVFYYKYNQCIICDEIYNVYLKLYGENWTLSEEEYSAIIDGVPSEDGYIYYNEAANIVLQNAWYTVYESACVYYEHNVLIVKQDDVEILNIHYIDKYDNHDYQYTYEFYDPDKGCDGGYRVTVSCDKCGEIIKEYYDYGHNYTEIHDELYNEDGVYLGYYKSIQCLVCGEYSDLWVEFINYAGSDENSYTDDDGVLHYEYVCYDYYDNSYIETSYAYDLGNCYYHYIVNKTLIVNDEVIFDIDKDYYETNHDYQNTYEYVFLNDEHDCGQGVRIYQRCIVCGEFISYDRYYHSYKYTHGQFGATDEYSEGVINYEVYACEVCGKVSDYFYIYCNTSSTLYKTRVVEKTTELIDGCEYEVTVTRFDEIGLVYTETIHYEPTDESCYLLKYRDVFITQNGEVLFNKTEIDSIEQHDFDIDVVFSDELLKCDGCYEATYTCKVCGYSYYTYGSYHAFNSNFIDLTTEYEDFNCFIIYEYECEICGLITHEFSYDHAHSMTYSYNYFVDDDGYSHSVYAHYCQTCGFRHQEDEYSILSGCDLENHTINTYTINGELIYEYEDITYEKQHYYNVTYVFDDDENCENGVTYYYVCKRCGYSFDSHCSEHSCKILDTYDMQELGSVNEGTITYSHCACGKNAYISINSACDFYSRYINNLSDPSPLFDSRYSSGYIYTCASTDPECKFTYLYEYRLYYKGEDTCDEYSFAHYYFGYNVDDGTYKLHLVVPRYDTTHHNYECIESWDDNVFTELNQCSRCGAWYKHTYTYDEETQILIKEEYEYSNGEYQLTEYQILQFGSNYFSILVLQYYIEKANDYWGLVEYEYPVDYCHRLVKYSDLYNNNEEYEETYHIWTKYVNFENPTCSQCGGYGECCVICGELLSSYLIKPIGHNFVYDNEKEVYVCSICGLKNSVGVTGSMIMEDLSNNNYYIVGYYNSNSVQFMEYVSIIVNPGEEDEDEIFLDDVPVYNNYNYSISRYFYKDDVIANAYQLGYEEGTYLVKFTFVPFGADSNYDYAIVFE